MKCKTDATPRSTRRSTSRSKGGFTLTELLIVVAIIGILASMTYGAISMAVTRARKGATQALISAINAGIQNFRTDFGSIQLLKGTTDAQTREKVRLWLLGLGNGGDPDTTVRNDPRWPGDPYLDIQPDKHLGQSDHILVDSWEEPIYFELDEDKVVFNIDRWDIWSLGPDGKGTTNMGDITGGTYDAKRKDYKDKADNLDNIGNW